MEQDWRDYTGALTSFEYMKSKNYTLVPATAYKQPEKDANLEKIWEKVSECILRGSWNAIYADSDQEFEAIVAAMLSQARAYGYAECVDWCGKEAEKRYGLERAVRN